MNKYLIKGNLLLLFVVLVSCRPQNSVTDSHKPCYSGIYPHLAYYNNEGECGTGAIVPWQNRLWVVTYGPHLPWGSSDKLYEITDTLGVRARAESVGGTSANRLIHSESNQLFIGPYAIDSNRNVRVISYKEAQGRYTGVARHLSNPAEKVYIATMEEGFYEIDVNTLKANTLYPDVNGGMHDDTDINPTNDLLPGAHGKGVYSGQGVLVFSNNGEATHEALEKFNIPAGCLAEWNGKDWKVIRRNQFTEVTGPGGIYGNPHPETDPVWATGWDYKSLLLALREKGEWRFFRLPKASNSYDGAHGWNTEWPRIRNIGTKDNPDYLMTMHGMFWHFPETFCINNMSGIFPRSSYLKVVGDFTRWHDRIVFGCDDTAQKDFLNKRKIKGNIGGPGQSNSNLWFVSPERIDQLGPTNASGSVWMNDTVVAGQTSDPFLFNGWDNRCVWVRNDSKDKVCLTFEVDVQGNGQWTVLCSKSIDPKSSSLVTFTPKDKGEWIRISTDKTSVISATFVFAMNEKRTISSAAIFEGITRVNEKPVSEGTLYCLGDNRRCLGILARTSEGEKYYELSGDMKLENKNDIKTVEYIRRNFEINAGEMVVSDGSVLIIDDKERRWRLPLGKNEFTTLTKQNKLRICREVATERDLFNCHGTFYELPAENADGFAKIRPISSHKLRINDYASYRGLLILSGMNANDCGNKRMVVSDDKKLTLWAGTIDDLWELGKPVGSGGPWVDAQIEADEYSDPYLIGFYDERILNISHKSFQPVRFYVEMDPTGDGHWMEYKHFDIAPGESFIHHFPPAVQARWIRFRTDSKCVATTWLEYK